MSQRFGHVLELGTRPGEAEAGGLGLEAQARGLRLVGLELGTALGRTYTLSVAARLHRGGHSCACRLRRFRLR